MSEGQYTFRPSVERRRILVVEDEFVNQEILKSLIGEAYEVVPAYTGAEAMELVRTQHETLSLILLDLNLPDIQGLELLRRIREDAAFSRLPVIVMTADREAEVESLTLGAIDFIPKPYPQQKVILARVRRTIELSEDRDILRWTERDHLTGLYNKEFFYRYAAQLDAYHKDAPADAILLNINHFRTLNDRYGKSYGDEVLKRVAESMLEIVKDTGGIVCRSEADTFLIYCPHCGDYDAMLAKAGVSMPGGGGSGGRVRMRMGVYANVDKTLDVERRFDRAKMAADTVRGNYAKSIGLFDNTLRETELRSEQLIEDFPAALRERQFLVFFQPKFDVHRDEPMLSSAEALVRWRHPKLGMISPGVFIPLFENNGLIQALDQYVWADAAAHIRAWKERLGVALPVSVNVSRVDIYDPELEDKLARLLETFHLDPGELMLEITETAYADNADNLIEVVQKLRGRGFMIEMDDFGSGYSSLNMLTTIPIDVLKMDMKFIRNMLRDEKSLRLVELIVDIAQFLGVPVVAEGVEEEAQLRVLKEMGCACIQGYYFSKPVPPADFVPFIEAEQA